MMTERSARCVRWRSCLALYGVELGNWRSLMGNQVPWVLPMLAVGLMTIAQCVFMAQSTRMASSIVDLTPSLTASATRGGHHPHPQSTKRLYRGFTHSTHIKSSHPLRRWKCCNILVMTQFLNDLNQPAELDLSVVGFPPLTFVSQLENQTSTQLYKKYINFFTFRILQTTSLQFIFNLNLFLALNYYI